MALALASTGKRVLVIEVEGRQGISQTYDVAPLSVTETKLFKVAGGGEIWGLSIEPKAALLEYLDLFYHLGRAGKALEKVGAIDFATTIAPGVRDVLTTGKVYDVARRQERGVEGGFDAIVLDAPPTGRVANFLGVGGELADLTKVGPIRNQAESVATLFRSRITVVHVLTLLEEMPVQEAVDAVTQLQDAGLRIGAMIVNQAREPHLTAEDLDAAADGTLDRAALASELESLHLPHDDETISGLVAEAHAHADRMSLEDEQLAIIESLGRPVYLLPVLAEGVDANTVRELADSLSEQAVW